MATRKELVEALQGWYRSTEFGDRIKILDEFVTVTGYHRKHAIRVLCVEVPTAKAARNRNRLYDEAVRQALTALRVLCRARRKGAEQGRRRRLRAGRPGHRDRAGSHHLRHGRRCGPGRVRRQTGGNLQRTGNQTVDSALVAGRGGCGVVGNLALLREAGVIVSAAADPGGETPEQVAVDGKLVGVIFIADTLRPGAREALA